MSGDPERSAPDGPYEPGTGYGLAPASAIRTALLNAMPAHIAVLDVDGTVLDVNDRWRHFGLSNGYRQHDLGVGRNYIEICRRAAAEAVEDAERIVEGLQSVLAGTQDAFVLEYPCHAPNEQRWFRLVVEQLLLDPDRPGPQGAVVMHVDITDRVLAERQLSRIAYHDPVTDTMNRRGFIQAFEEWVLREGWPSDGFIVMLDIEGLRKVNDAHGFACGDRLLARIGRRLHERMGGSGIVGRTGGDEFVVFFPPQPGRTGEDQRLLLGTAFEGPFELGAVRVDAVARFGYTRLGAQKRDAESLLHEAELALFEKGTPGGVWGEYTDALDFEARRRLRLSGELRRALDDRQFELHYQPKVDLQSGRMVAGEALMRWNHPERGLQSPGVFIPIAEQSQLIVPLGNWALREACRHLRDCRNDGLTGFAVSVNVSMVQLRSDAFFRRVRDALNDYGIPPEALTLEITESVFENESDRLRQRLQDLHDLGIRLSLDDFGTGYSSLLYLQRYPFDEIKVDRGFVMGILHDSYSRRIVQTVIGIADALGADVVAEGVETRAVADALQELGVRVVQGFYYSVPLAIEDFRWLLSSDRTLPVRPSGGEALPDRTGAKGS